MTFAVHSEALTIDPSTLQVNASKGVKVGTAWGIDTTGRQTATGLPANYDDMFATYGLLSATGNPVGISTGGTPSSQTGYFVTLPLRAGQVVTNIVTIASIAGAGTAPTTIKLGLANTAGEIKAVTANVKADAQWTTGGFCSFAVTTPYTVETTGGYQVLFLQDGTWGTTTMLLGRNGGNNVTYGSLNSVPLMGNFGTGKTDITGTLEYTSAMGTSAFVNFWAGVN